jgi:hypothetical protein
MLSFISCEGGTAGDSGRFIEPDIFSVHVLANGELPKTKRGRDKDRTMGDSTAVGARMFASARSTIVNVSIATEGVEKFTRPRTWTAISALDYYTSFLFRIRPEGWEGYSRYRIKPFHKFRTDDLNLCDIIRWN